MLTSLFIHALPVHACNLAYLMIPTTGLQTGITLKKSHLRPPGDALILVAHLQPACGAVCPDQSCRVSSLYGRHPVQERPGILRRLIGLPALIAELKVPSL